MGSLQRAVWRSFVGSRRFVHCSSAVFNKDLDGDKIHLEGLLFHGFHGVLPEERSLGQKFVVDATLHCSLESAGQSDDLEHTVSYADVYHNIKEIVEGQPRQLLESVAETIASRVLDSYPKVQAIRVKVTKPHVAVPGPLKSLGVEVVRQRK